jgi:hypothetical protein
MEKIHEKSQFEENSRANNDRFGDTGLETEIYIGKFVEDFETTDTPHFRNWCWDKLTILSSGTVPFMS